jgi:hypothetical protein
VSGVNNNTTNNHEPCRAVVRAVPWHFHGTSDDSKFSSKRCIYRPSYFILWQPPFPALRRACCSHDTVYQSHQPTNVSGLTCHQTNAGHVRGPAWSYYKVS